jgi:hypothetical protein
MDHTIKVCEDDNVNVHGSDKIIWKNTQALPVSIIKHPDNEFPFKPGPPIIVFPLVPAISHVRNDLPARDYKYNVEGCPKEVTPKTVIIS